MMKKIICGLSTILLMGCINTVKTDVLSDKEDAEKIAEQLYSNLEKNEYQDAHKLFSSKFFDVTPPDSLNNIFQQIRTLGDYKHRTLADWSTFSVTGSRSKTEYMLNYVVEYTLYPAQEIIRMEKEEDEIFIISYEVYSDGFEQ
ncbi:hypothetical protein [Avrilella dinanensis]|nr:hypothetical protein [Avrilella dinanensis]